MGDEALDVGVKGRRGERDRDDGRYSRSGPSGAGREVDGPVRVVLGAGGVRFSVGGERQAGRHEEVQGVGTSTGCLSALRPTARGASAT